MRIEGANAILHFTHLGGGLMAKDGELKDFTIAGMDKVFHPAQVKIVGETVVVPPKCRSPSPCVTVGRTCRKGTCSIARDCRLRRSEPIWIEPVAYAPIQWASKRACAIA
jgi:sialate O-acetylesterase